IKKNSEKFLGVSKEDMTNFVGKVRAAALLHEYKNGAREEMFEVIPDEEKEGAKAMFDAHDEKEKQKEVEKEKEKMAMPKRRSKDIEHER
ncbi:hypothetical protein QMA04_18090, partial [Planococcus sp. APC 3900]|uniref:hypothetical protein n=1 Tax=Planococcus sp. APC 3900 TaxID=3035191 RepID=UPI0025B62326